MRGVVTMCGEWLLCAGSGYYGIECLSVCMQFKNSAFFFSS